MGDTSTSPCTGMDSGVMGPALSSVAVDRRAAIDGVVCVETSQASRSARGHFDFGSARSLSSTSCPPANGHPCSRAVPREFPQSMTYSESEGRASFYVRTPISLAPRVHVCLPFNVVDRRSPAYYITTFDLLPSSLTLSEHSVRANIRWKEIGRVPSTVPFAHWQRYFASGFTKVPSILALIGFNPSYALSPCAASIRLPFVAAAINHIPPPHTCQRTTQLKASLIIRRCNRPHPSASYLPAYDFAETSSCCPSEGPLICLRFVFRWDHQDSRSAKILRARIITPHANHLYRRHSSYNTSPLAPRISGVNVYGPPRTRPTLQAGLP
ncbi:hypothetical protein EVG20_g7349 [Dentipellis fragilis]|uniref:Uncharacterized protein n=1 Tax=Dentipellis fragilis TaxID=205917 RepID=A0A4Y9YGF8_9AGAM|nr:hypothetical protein EVG20_g7349 [Dentipellis fragilis]